MRVRGKKGEATSSEFATLRFAAVALTILGLLFLAVLGVRWFGLADTIFGGRLVHCGNAADFQRVVAALQDLEAGRQIPQVFFSSTDNCYLVGFNEGQYETLKVFSSSHQTRGGPRMCLCKIEDGSECVPYRQCYRFSRFKTLGAEQFSSQEYAQDIFMKFVPEGERLGIEVLGKAVQPEHTYAFKEQFRLLDATALVQRLQVRFSGPSARGFLPIVEVQPRPELTIPELAPAGGLPLFFAMRLVKLPANQDVKVGEFVAQAETISPGSVQNVVADFLVPQRVLAGVSDAEPVWKWWMQVDGTWMSYDLACVPAAVSYQCHGEADRLGSAFAITVVQQNAQA